MKRDTNPAADIKGAAREEGSMDTTTTTATETETRQGLKIQREELAGRFYVKITRPKGRRPYAYYAFRTREQREAYIDDQVAGQVAHAASVARRRTERSAPHKFQPGDVLVYSWGYEQTNVEFFQVTGTTSHTVRMRPIESAETARQEGYSSMSSHVTAVKDAFRGTEITKRANAGGYVAMDHGAASMWDGRPRYCSWYA